MIQEVRCKKQDARGKIKILVSDFLLLLIKESKCTI